MKNNEYNKKRFSAISAGLLFIIFGILLLAKTWGLIDEIPDWLISWPTIVIAIGLISGIRHRFSRPGAYYMIGIGTAFLADRIYPNLSNYQLLFPSILLAGGLYLIFGKHNHTCGFKEVNKESYPES